MKYRRFGRTGWKVSEIGYGMWGMGGWTGSDDEESLASLQRAVDLGCNFFDTAWGYGDGHSEGLLGQLVRANPGKQLYTATKIPPKNFKWPSRARVHPGRLLPARPHRAVRPQQPEERRAGVLRPDAVPHLGGQLGAGRPAGRRSWTTCAARA